MILLMGIPSQQKHEKPQTINHQPEENSPKTILRRYCTQDQAVAARLGLVAYYKIQTWQGPVKC